MSEEEPKFTIYGPNGPEDLTITQLKDRQEALREQKQNEWRDTNHKFWGGIRTLLDKADADERESLTAMFMSMQTNQTKVDFYVGWIVAYFEQTRNICTSCGVDHEQDMNKALEELLAVPPDQSAMFTESGDVVADLVVEDAAELPILPDYDQTTLDEYGVELMYKFAPDDADGPNDARLICTRCWNGTVGWYWPNLEDRMKRCPGVDGCPRCIDKAKNG